jgi:hypothetical protein
MLAVLIVSVGRRKESRMRKIFTLSGLIMHKSRRKERRKGRKEGVRDILRKSCPVSVQAHYSISRLTSFECGGCFADVGKFVKIYL